jgi:hypothetical protein
MFSLKRIAKREGGSSQMVTAVHGTVKYPAELDVIAAQGVTLLPLSALLQELCTVGSSLFTGTAGGDLAEIIAFHAGRKGGTAPGEQQQQSPNPPAGADG